MEAVFTPILAGNRRAERRKLARSLGEMPRRMRQRNKRLASMPASSYVLPDMRVTVSRCDGELSSLAVLATATIRVRYPRYRRTIPEWERPSDVVVTRF